MNPDEVWSFVAEWLEPVAIARLQDDYEHRELYARDRRGGSTAISRPDFAAGWMAGLARARYRSYFTPMGQQRFGIART